MSKFLATLFFLASILSLQASESKADSLRNVVDTCQTDSGKANALDYLVWEYMYSNTDEAINIAYEQVVAAKKTGMHVKISKAFFNLGTAHAVKGMLVESVPIFYQGLDEAEKANSPKKKSQILNNLGLVYKLLAKPDSAISFYERSVSEFKKLSKLEKGLADTYNNIGQLFVDKGDVDSATHYLNLAIEIHSELEIRDLSTADIYNNLGIIYKEIGRYPNALDSYLKARKIHDALKDTSNKYGYILNNIGEIYDKQEDYNKALEYYTYSAEVIGKVGSDAVVYSRVMNNIGQIYIQEKKLDTALTILTEASQIQENSDIGTLDLAETYSNMGQVHELKGNLELAEDYYSKSLAISEKGDLKITIVEALLDLGRLKISSGRTQEGIQQCQRSFKLAEELKLLQQKMLSCECLYEGNDKTGNVANAYKYYKFYREYRDSLINQENVKEITAKAMQYEFDKVQYQDSLKRAEKERQQAMIQREKDIKQEAEIQKQRAYTIASIVGIVLMMGLAFVLFKGYKNKQKANEIITEQKEAVEEQKEIIEEKNREIVDSISYAQRIQNAILPSDEYIKSVLPNAFVYFNPKDIVSGDFYWIDEKDDCVYFAAVDCTGHGVPGALVSVVGYNGLNRVLHEFNLTDPAKMLDKLSELVERTFSKSSASIKDGMDLALCKWDKKNNLLEYAGANNPMYLVRDNDKIKDSFKNYRILEHDELDKSLIEIKADKQPIGKYDFREPFQSHKISLEKGDSIYVFSDGYADQFGGVKGKKFMYKPFKKLLTQLSSLKMDEQKEKVTNTFSDWKGSMEQIDDVCVLGVRI